MQDKCDRRDAGKIDCGRQMRQTDVDRYGVAQIKEAERAPDPRREYSERRYRDVDHHGRE